MLFVCVGFFFLFIILVSICYLRIELMYQRKGEDDEGYILFSLFRNMLRYRFKISRIDFEGIQEGITIETETENDKKEQAQIPARLLGRARHMYEELLDQVTNFQGILKKFLGTVRCEKFSWRTSIGTGDAAETGIVCGMAWGLVTSIVGFMGSYIRWKKHPHIEISPSFQQPKIDTYVHIIIRFRIGNAIRGIVQLLLRQHKGRKGAKKWVSILSKA